MAISRSLEVDREYRALAPSGCLRRLQPSFEAPVKLGLIIAEGQDDLACAPRTARIRKEDRFLERGGAIGKEPPDFAAGKQANAATGDFGFHIRVEVETDMGFGHGVSGAATRRAIGAEQAVPPLHQAAIARQEQVPLVDQSEIRTVSIMRHGQMQAVGLLLPLCDHLGRPRYERASEKAVDQPRPREA